MIDQLDMEEIINLAKEGNNDAILAIYALGIECSKLQDVENAEFLFDLAGTLGLPQAAWEAIKLYRIRAQIYMNNGLYIDAITQLNKLTDLVSTATSDDDFCDKIDEKTGLDYFTLIEKYYNDADYNLLICLEELKDTKRVLTWTKEIKEDNANYQRFQVIRGNTLYAIAAQNLLPLDEAYAVLRVAEPDSEYIPETTTVLKKAFEEKPYEELRFTLAALNLASLYEVGHRGIVAKDTMHAKMILETAYNKITAVPIKQALKERLLEME